jgi:hypothetical protein
MPFDEASHQRSVQTRATSKEIAPLKIDCYPALRDGAAEHDIFQATAFETANEHRPLRRKQSIHALLDHDSILQ